MLRSSIGRKGSAPGEGLPVQVEVLSVEPSSEQPGMEPIGPLDILVVLVLTCPHLFRVKLSL